jgi:hypothetical protein
LALLLVLAQALRYWLAIHEQPKALRSPSLLLAVVSMKEQAYWDAQEQLAVRVSRWALRWQHLAGALRLRQVSRLARREC